MNVLDGKAKWGLLCCLFAANGVPAQAQVQDVITAAAESAEAPAEARGLSSYWRRVAEHLQGHDDLRDRALAVLLWQAAAPGGPATVLGQGRPSARMLVSVGQSRDALALNLAVQAGLALDDPALVKAAALQWSQLEPDNLAPRLFLAASGDALLAQSDDIHRFDLHGYAPIRLMQQRFAEVPMTAAELAPTAYSDGLTEEGQILVSAFGLWAAYSYPSLVSLTRACRDDSLQATPQRRAQCLRLGRVLSQSSDTVLGQYLGIALLGYAADSPQERNAVTALRRTQAWQQYSRYSGSSNADTAEEIAQMLRLLRMPEIDNEVQLLEFRLREQGVALAPPEDWQPPQRTP